MSRIPIPASRNTSNSPTPYSDRPVSPLPTKATPPKPTVGFSTMSTMSGYQSNVSLSEHRKKQSRRDEVSIISFSSCLQLKCHFRQSARRLSPSCHESAPSRQHISQAGSKGAESSQLPRGPSQHSNLRLL